MPFSAYAQLLLRWVSSQCIFPIIAIAASAHPCLWVQNPITVLNWTYWNHLDFSMLPKASQWQKVGSKLKFTQTLKNPPDQPYQEAVEINLKETI